MASYGNVNVAAAGKVPGPSQASPDLSAGLKINVNNP